MKERARVATHAGMRAFVATRVLTLVLALVLALASSIRSGGALAAEDAHELALRRERNAASFATCDHQRSDAVACAMRFADTDHDGAITAAEIDAAKARYLPLAERVGVWLADVVGLETTQAVMRKCDDDGDGRITLDDFERSADSCLADCGRVNLLFKLVCAHAYEEERALAHERYAQHA